MSRFSFSCAFVLFLFFAPLSFLSAPASAQEDRAEELRAMLQALMDSQTSFAEESEMELVWDGALQVEQVGNYYAATFPHASVILPTGGMVNVGILAMNALPGDTADEWKMTIAMPSPLVVYAPDGTVASKITLGSQKFAGIWSKKLNNFLHTDAMYHDIDISSEKEDATVLIPEISVVSRLTQNEQGLWSGPYKYTMNGLHLESPDLTGTIGKMSIVIDMRDFSIDEIAKLQEKLEAFEESIEESDSLEGDLTANALGYYNLVADYFMKVSDGFTSSWSVENLSFRGTDKRFALGNLGMDFDMTGFKQNQVLLRTAFSYDGLSLTPPPKNFDEVAPTTMRFDMSVSHLPFQDMMDIGRQALQAGLENPAMAQMVGLQSLMSLPPLLTAAHTSLRLDDSHVGNDGYKVKAHGEAFADMAAAHGATGTARLEISGFDYLLDYMKSSMNDPALAPEKRQRMASAMGVLTVLQMVGQNAADPQTGSPVRAYDFSLTGDGKVLLNGADINTVMQMAK